MCFAMSHLRVIHGGKEPPPTEHNLPSHPRLSEELRFGKPPRLLAGFVTSLFGAGAGVISLLLFFQLRQPHFYISREWLMFIAAGAVIGFFMRLERPFIELFGCKGIPGAGQR